MKKFERSTWLSVILLAAAFAMAGCSSTPRVPKDARLIWSGEIDQPGHLWKDILPEQSGQMYIVDHSTRRIEGVDSVWPGKTNFRFELRPHRRYDLYFARQDGPASRPAE